MGANTIYYNVNKLVYLLGTKHVSYNKQNCMPSRSELCLRQTRK